MRTQLFIKLEMIALNGAKPIDILGEWYDDRLYPIAAIINDRFVNLTYLGDLK